MPVTHDSMRLIEQVKTVCEHRIYLDEAKELYSLISSKWLHVRKYMTNYIIFDIYDMKYQDFDYILILRWINF